MNSVATEGHDALDWQRCVLCQELTSESLIDPCKGKKMSPEDSYSILEDLINEFHEAGEIPMKTDITFIDTGNGVKNALLQNQAKWHKSCRVKFNSKNLERAKKRKPEDENEKLGGSRFTRAKLMSLT